MSPRYVTVTSPPACVSMLEHFRLSPSRLSPSWSRLRPSTAWQTWTASPTCCPSRQVSSALSPANKQIAVNFNFLDFKVDAVSLNDLDFWDKGSERPEDRYVVASRPGHLEARWEQQHRSVSLSPPPPSHSHFPKNPAVWRFITSIYLPHSQMEPDDISSVQNREVGERQCGELQQLTFWFQLQRWRGLQSDWTPWECGCSGVYHSLRRKYFNTWCWKYFNKFFKVISVFNTCKACLNSKFFSTLRKFTKKLVLKRKCSHTKSHQHFIFFINIYECIVEPIYIIYFPLPTLYFLYKNVF